MNNEKNSVDEKISRIAKNAGNIVDMLGNAYKTEKGVDGLKILLFASGLAGYACHRAVKDSGKPFVEVKSTDGRIYYLGDDVNYYLLQGKSSVLSFMNGLYNMVCPDKELPNFAVILQNVTLHFGEDDYKIAGVVSPDVLFPEVVNCFDGIFENMTSKYCEGEDEWPILFGIALQNVMNEVMKVGNPDLVYNVALECLLFISKMDFESLKK